jgi:hypothetical protein
MSLFTKCFNYNTYSSFTIKKRDSLNDSNIGDLHPTKQELILYYENTIKNKKK